MRSRLWCWLFAFLSCASHADDNPLGMSYVETPDVRMIYFDPVGYLVPHAVRTFTNSLAWQRRMFGWLPSEATTVLLKDFSDYAVAVTIAAPRNLLLMDVEPLSHAFETFPASERMYSLMNHELVHIAQGDLGSSDERRWRKIFRGKVSPRSQNPETLLYSYLTIPRFNLPRWYAEGGAVFMETWMAGGLGRAQGGYDEMVFRAMVRDGTRFYDPLGLVSQGTLVDFQVMANAYLYGTRFMTWLALTHSPEKVVAWMRLDESSERDYARNFQHVFGMPLDRAWQDWITFEHAFQRQNLDAVRAHPITPMKTITTAAVGSISRMFYDDKDATIYAAFRYPGFVEHVGALNTNDGSLRRLADIKRAMHYRVASFAYDPQTGTAFYTNDNLALRDLMAVDVKSGASRMLLEDVRIGDLAFNPVDRSLWGVRHDNGLASLVRIPYPYDLWFNVHTFSYENVPYDLDISADGQRLSASMSEVDASQYVRVWETAKLLKGDLKPASEFKFGQSIPESFVFSRDGRYLYGSSYYTGVSNIFRYDVATGDVVAVSNAETGLFRPVPLADGRLLVLTYTGAGFVPAIIEPKVIEDVSAIRFLGAELADRHPVVTTWQVPPASTVDYDQLILRQGPYAPLHHVGLANAYPVLQGYKDSAGVGYRVNFSDPINFANANATVAYTPTGTLSGGERLHADISGDYLGWHGGASWNKSDFYDLFGPTKRGRKGLAVKFGYDNLLVYDEPRRLNLITDLAYLDKIDTLPNAQNVATPFTRLATLDIGLHFTDVRRSLGAVEDEKGLVWAGDVRASLAKGRVTPQVRALADVGFALPYPHASLWMRTAAGTAEGARDDPVAKFYFGGFGNNYVDDGTIKRYREYTSLPGFGIDEVSALNFVRELVELNLPPLTFERVGTPGFYLTWLRPSVFAAGLLTDPGSSTLRKTYGSVGTQADLRFTVIHRYDMTLSIGYALGYRSGHRVGSEWMVSLKIM
ncbi:MAG: hypothetical protein ABIS17_04115 [Casimicrobiaceae bacterium]